MNKIYYPCNIREENGIYYVNFLDFDEAFTDGETFEEAIKNAKDVLEAVAYSYIKHKKKLPKPTFSKQSGNLVYIDLWVDLVKDRVNNKSIRKTLTIPKWLNDLAEDSSVNFSNVLQTALKEYLSIK